MYRYWGQNSRGVTHPNETEGYQKSLSFYCQVSWFPIYPTPSEGTETRSDLFLFLFLARQNIRV